MRIDADGMAEHVVLWGPEAAAAQARSATQRLADAELSSTEVGLDGDVWCVFHVDQSGRELLPAEEQDELLGRRARRALRFASRQALDRHLQADGAALPMLETPTQVRGGAIGLSWSCSSGQLNAGADVSIIGDRLDLRVAEGMASDRRVARELAVDGAELSRFAAELDLLRIGAWRTPPAPATDGMEWRVQVSGDLRGVATGVGEAPEPLPGLEGTDLLGRAQLALERLAGMELWPRTSPELLSSIRDPDARTEHALLMALRRWASALHVAGDLPQNRKEPGFQAELRPFLEECFSEVALEIDLKASANRELALDRWPGLGRVDVMLGRSTERPVWVELKWGKSAGTLHNCAWDAAKLAEALRSQVASRGYLVAGAPASQWSKAGQAAQLFASKAWHSDEIVSGFASSWRTWLDEGGATGLVDLPSPLVTTPVGRVIVPVEHDEDWEIRVSRVDAPGSARTALTDRHRRRSPKRRSSADQAPKE